jgi:hypothetical protein
MKELTILCDQCRKRLNGSVHIQLGLTEESGMSDGLVYEKHKRQEPFIDPTDFIKNYKNYRKEYNEFDDFNDKKLGYVKPFKGINSEMAFCDSKCLAKFFENKENEVKLEKLNG